MADEGAIIDENELTGLVEDLSGSSRRRRQDAAHSLALVAQQRPELLHQHLEVLLDALQRPEALTRWEILSALGEIAVKDASLVEEAYDGAEASLFDEDSAIVRLAAFRFLVRLGASAPERSEQVWPLLNEAIQCYHGDPEYRDMLIALTEFAAGDLSENTRDALALRVAFDAENGRGYIRVLSSEIASIVDTDDA